MAGAYHLRRRAQVYRCSAMNVLRAADGASGASWGDQPWAGVARRVACVEERLDDAGVHRVDLAIAIEVVVAHVLLIRATKRRLHQAGIDQVHLPVAIHVAVADPLGIPDAAAIRERIAGQHNRGIPAPVAEERAIGREIDGRYAVRLPIVGSPQSPVRDVPQLDRPFPTARRQQFTVGRKGD